MSDAKNLSQNFQQAATQVQQLKTRPSNDELLELYALFKQGSVGNASGARPGIFDIKGRKKFDAWASKKDISTESAQTAYIKLVENLSKKSNES